MTEPLSGFTFNHADQPDRLSDTMTPAEVKAAFDSRGEELRLKVNEIIFDRNLDYPNAFEYQTGYKGLCVRTWETGSLYTDRFRVYAIEKAETINADSIELVINTYQASETSNDPTARVPVGIPEIEDYIIFLRNKGYRIFFKPHVEIDETPYIWRANIDPTDPDLWFSTYQSLMLDYAELCQKYNVELLSIGAEYVNLTTKYPDKWVSLIEQIRAKYNGGLTYAANCNSANHDEISIVTFWDKLDYIGVDYYNDPTTDLNSSVDDIKSLLFFNLDKDNAVMAVDRVYQMYKKPVVFAEYGMSASTDDERIYQSNYAEAFLDIFRNKNYTKGTFAWVVDPIDGSTDNYLKDGSSVLQVIEVQHEYTTKNITSNLRYYGTPKNTNSADKWCKIATIKLIQEFMTSSCTFYLENLLANTSKEERGMLYFRVGSDSSLASFVELTLNAESTILGSSVGYVINADDSVDIYIKLIQFDQYVYALERSNGVEIMQIYDYPSLVDAPSGLTNGFRIGDLGNNLPSFPNGVKVLMGTVSGSMSNGLINVDVTLPSSISTALFYAANVNNIGGGNSYDVTVQVQYISNTSIRIFGKHSSGAGSYGYSIKWIILGV